MGHEWKEAIPEADRLVYEEAGFGRDTGLGTRPALLVIDVQYRTIGDEPAPILESMRRHYRTSCGDRGWKAVEGIERVIAAGREGAIPIVYPYVAPKTAVDAGRAGERAPSVMEVPSRGYAFPDAIAPKPEDLLIPKRHPSAFFGTALASYLIDMQVDSLLITGCTTSGCVRATATDGSSYNFHCAVIEECVYDRSELSHNVNLFELQAKYADVITVDAALDYLAKTTLGVSGAAP